MRAVGDPLLGAGDAAVGVTRVRIALGVGARARLGERERADLLARRRAAGRLLGEPWASSGSVHALVCTATVTPTPASARESSSSTST